jgi:TPR repeat protein
MVNLGRFLKAGLATDKNPKAAVKWFTRAVARGDNDANLQLAQMYLSADGIKKEPDETRQ